ncbi:MAG: DNA primase [Deltaproteobacteria bacterium]|nr:DNA primase [Deltaproteobacteria bacterium]
MSLFPEEKLAEIRQKVPISEVIAEYVQLSKSGKSLRGLCPFHQEKTPSFYVSPERETFHCFGCGEGGTVFHFLMKLEGYSFNEAVTKMAQKAGVVLENLPQQNSKEFYKKDRLLEIQRQAAWYYHCYLKKLSENAEVWSYLNKRHVKRVLAEDFFLGYCPNQNSGLEKHLFAKGFSKEEIQKSGLFKGSREFFRGRLLFPIFRFDKKVVGFGGRLIDQKNYGPKYINSAESSVFKKGELFYGLNWAKESIRQSGQVFIVEGYMDVMALHAHGFKNTIAPLGTAMTLFHIKTLKRLAQEPILIFDGDIAGQQASLKALELFLEQDQVPNIVELASDEDPDSLLRISGQLEFENRLKNKRNLLENLIDKWSAEALQSQSLEKKGQIAKRGLELINKIPDYFKRQLYREYLAQALQVPVAWLESWEQKFKEGFREKLAVTKPVEKNKRKNHRFDCLPEEEAIFEAWLKYADIRDELQEELSWEDFFSKSGKEIAKKMWSWRPEFSEKLNAEEATADFLNLLSEEETRYLSALLMKSSVEDDDFVSVQRNDLDQIILRLEEKKLKFEIQALPTTFNDLGALKNKIEALSQVMKNKERLYGQK